MINTKDSIWPESVYQCPICKSCYKKYEDADNCAKNHIKPVEITEYGCYAQAADCLVDVPEGKEYPTIIDVLMSNGEVCTYILHSIEEEEDADIISANE